MTTTEHSAVDVSDRKSSEVADGEWRAHPLGSLLLRSIIVVIPLAIASTAGLMVGGSIGGNGIRADVTRVLVAGIVSLVAFVIAERISRRFLPLAMLLKLSLVFPDQAPSRFSVALRSTSVKKLQHWAKAAQVDEGPAALAEKVVTLATALNTHDRRTRGHSDRSRAMAELIATEMGLTESEINEVRWGAFLHDIGKILVPAALLNKPGKPTASEWETLKRHPAEGGKLVEPLRGFLGSGVEAVSGHHENFDGTGYPRGFAGHDIALSARIVSVADSFEVMTAVRAYKKPMKAAEAREELARNSGTQFDPSVVRALLNVSLGRLHWTLGLAAWVAEMPFLTVIPRAAAQAGAFAAGPTVTMAALSSVATISLGTAVAPMAMATPQGPAPENPTHSVVVAASTTHDLASPTTAPVVTQGQADVSGESGIAPAPTSSGASGDPAKAPSTTTTTSPDIEPSYSANAMQSPPSATTSAGSNSTSPSTTTTTTKPTPPAPAPKPTPPAPKPAPPAPAPKPTPPAPKPTPPAPPPASATPATAPKPTPPAPNPTPPTPAPTPPAPTSNPAGGNPHQPGQTGDPHQPGQTGNPRG